MKEKVIFQNPLLPAFQNLLFKIQLQKMKTIKNLFVLVSASFLYACNPTDMTTVIHSDGSCTRIFTQQVDEKFIKGDTSQNPFPIPIDENWKIQWQYLTKEIHHNWPVKNWEWDKKDTNHIVTAFAVRNFNSVKNMSDAFKFKKDFSWHNLNIKASLEKKFRWFYTYYIYKESYSKIPIDFKVPIEKYLTKDEISFWLTGEPNLLKGQNGIEIAEFTKSLEAKFNNWLLENIWTLQYESLVNNLSLFPGHPEQERMEQAKDSIFHQLIKLDLKDIYNYNLGELLNKYFKTTAFTFLDNAQDAEMKKIIEPEAVQIFQRYNENAINHKIVLPGKIIVTNGILSADTSSWKVDTYRILYTNYELKATSRKLNIWSFILSAIIILSGFLFILKKATLYKRANYLNKNFR